MNEITDGFISQLEKLVSKAAEEISQYPFVLQLVQGKRELTRIMTNHGPINKVDTAIRCALHPFLRRRYGPADGRTEGRTDPLIEMRRRRKVKTWYMNNINMVLGDP